MATFASSTTTCSCCKCDTFVGRVTKKIEKLDAMFFNRSLLPNGPPLFRDYSVRTTSGQPKTELGDLLATLAGRLEANSYEFWHGGSHHRSRRIIYNPTRTYDELDPAILNDYNAFCSVFLDF